MNFWKYIVNFFKKLVIDKIKDVIDPININFVIKLKWILRK